MNIRQSFKMKDYKKMMKRDDKSCRAAISGRLTVSCRSCRHTPDQKNRNTLEMSPVLILTAHLPYPNTPCDASWPYLSIITRPPSPRSTRITSKRSHKLKKCIIIRNNYYFFLNKRQQQQRELILLPLGALAQVFYGQK